MLAYIFDEQVKKEINNKKQNYWDAYIKEIDNLMGSCAAAISLDDIEQEDRLSFIKTLIIGCQSGAGMTEKARINLEKWVSNGGILIGFALQGFDDIFGIHIKTIIKQISDDYCISGYFEFYPHKLTKEIHPMCFKEQKLIIVSDIMSIELNGAVELGHLYDMDGKDLKQPVITWHKYGMGYTAYFAFDVAKTIWLLHQGKPLEDFPGDQNFLKTSLLSILGNNSRKVAYADEITFLLQNMIAQNFQPFIYQIPPTGQTVPDALFYWSGDEYFGPVELSIHASEWMKKKGLPYHINIGVEQNLYKKDGHPMSREDFEQILKNGHEISLWFCIVDCDASNYSITEKNIKYQSDLFFERFGYRPVCTLMNACNWQGWSEPARWMANSGGKADNTFFGGGQPGNHPLYNSSFFGFGFGTSYPFYFYEDFRYENRCLDYIEEPIICYELGHRGSIGYPDIDKETKVLEEVYLPIDMAVKYHFVMNFFYHPVYIVNYPVCKEAIEEILKYIEWKGYSVAHMGNDQVCEWWNARSHTKVENLTINKDSLCYKTVCDYSSGIIIKMYLNGRRVSKVVCDDQPIQYQIKNEFMGEWIYITIPTGEHILKIHLNKQV